MNDYQNSKESISKRGHGHWLGGIFLIAIGLYWLGKKAGWLPPEIHMYWPVIFIIIGGWVIVRALLKRHE